MMRVADYIARFVRDQLHVDTVFMVSGGGMMFLSDGLAQCRSLRVVCNHHEQASAMAAAGYAKQRNSFACAMVTTGCGGTNAMTGLLNAWQDSARVFFVSGQCKQRQTIRGSGIPLRQFGVQEADIVAVVTPLTKYAVMLKSADDVAYELEKAKWLSGSGRTGPVWIDVPMDIQGATVDERKLRHFPLPGKALPAPSGADAKWLAKRLASAQRPVVLAGQGVALSGTQKSLEAFAARWKIPVVTSFLGGNSISGKSPYYIGRIGSKGARAANIAVANADFLLVIGCRLSVSTTGHEYGLFARHAEIAVVDIDPVEHSKGTVRIDRLIRSDLREFFKFDCLDVPEGHTDRTWLDRCRSIKKRYPIIPSRCATDDGRGISLYAFMDCLNHEISGHSGWTAVSDAGSSFYVTSQTVETTSRQRYITSGGEAEMGFTLPASIGSAAGGAKKVLGITGDGSLQMNIQELQTLKYYGFPVKLFVWNNNGYLSIRATQRKFFNGRFIGTDATCGVSFPDLRKIAHAYGLRYVKIGSRTMLSRGLAEAIKGDDPVVCEVMCKPDEVISPSIASIKLPSGQMKSMPPEDMFPFLPWDEFKSLMIVPPIPRS